MLRGTPERSLQSRSATSACSPEHADQMHVDKDAPENLVGELAQ